MRVLIYGLNFLPELTGIGKYTGEMAEWLAGQGHQVRVITAPPYYPEWAVYKGYSAWQYTRLHRADSLAVYRCPLWVPARVTGFKRLLHLASFAVSSLPVLLTQVFWRPQAVFCVAPTLFCAPAAWLAARLCGAKVWLHIQDFEVDAAFSLGILQSPLLKNVVTAAERWLLRRFDRVSSISTRMVERLSAKGVALQSQCLFPNWVDTDRIKPLAEVSPLRSRLALPDDAIVVLYSGNMGEKQGLDVLLEAAALLAAKPNIHFLLCGDGVERRRLEQQAAGLTNLRWMDLQPLDQLSSLLNAADIHALPQRAGAADLVMPSKLTGMMASGRPTVASTIPGTEIANAVDGAGLLVPAGDAHAFAGAIETLANDPALRTRLGAVARARAVDAMGKEAILGKFERDLLACLAAP